MTIRLFSVTPWMNKSRCFKSVGKRVYWDTKLQQTRSRIIISITIYSVNSSFVDPLPIHLVVVPVQRVDVRSLIFWLLTPVLQLLEGEHRHDDEHEYPNNNRDGHSDRGRV